MTALGRTPRLRSGRRGRTGALLGAALTCFGQFVAAPALADETRSAALSQAAAPLVPARDNAPYVEPAETTARADARPGGTEQSGGPSRTPSAFIQKLSAPPLFSYRTEVDSAPLRAAAEELALLVIGLGYYFYNKNANSVDWDLNYDWASLEGKLTGKSYALDTNLFETNFISHPFDGMLYYLAARGNRLSALYSFLYAFTTSAVWEILGEYRERVSVNDVIVTPIAGMVIGETLTGLGTWFERGCPSSFNRVAAGVFTPFKKLHDWIDDAEPVEPRCHLARPGEHEFRLGVTQNAVFPLSAHGVRGESVPTSETAASLLLETSRVDLLGPAREETYSDGNHSRLTLDFALGKGGVTHAGVAARIVPVGIHLVQTAESGPRATDVGLLLAMHYEAHRYDRESPGFDRLFVLDFPAIAAGYRRRIGPGQLRIELDAGASFAGVDAFALPAFEAQAERSTLTSIAAEQGYNYALGFSLGPRVRYDTRATSVELSARSDRLFVVRGLDRYKPPSSVEGSETRRTLRLAVSVRAEQWLRVRTALDLRQRQGTLGTASASRTEAVLSTGLELATP